MVLRGRRGFTLIELLVVIVIILLLLALVLPAIVKAICSAREGATKTFIVQLYTAADMYEKDWAVFPPGNGSGTKELASYLSKEGPKKLPYFNFHQDQLTPSRDIMNPIWSEMQGPEGKVYYRNNIAGSTGTGSGGGGGGGGNQPPVYNRKSVDVWCAGCNYEAGQGNTGWGVNNWE